MKIVDERIESRRRDWGKKLFILGHHYQSPSVLRHVDVIGDSLELSRQAAQACEAERIVFCGVHFMAESAALLSAPTQTVYMPDTHAGCPMASMADIGDVEAAWQVLNRAGSNWVPVVYINSTAAIKAFCGRYGGCTCTSSNAAKVLRWVWDSGKKPFFLPDEHLGVNTAHDLGETDDAVEIYDHRRPEGGLTIERLARARMVVWKGFCRVHVNFKPKHVEEVRRQWPQAKIIVHPETPKEVVRLADAHGSTSQIIDYVKKAPAGSIIVIGTESHLVERLAEEERGRVRIMALWPSLCTNMAKTTPEKLADLLDEWPQRNRVSVDSALATEARLALDRMLRL